MNFSIRLVYKYTGGGGGGVGVGGEWEWEGKGREGIIYVLIQCKISIID